VKYSAFISYSSKDVAAARWLHRALEAYRLPANTKVSHPALRPGGRRLLPVFRDRDELSAGHDLAAAIKRGLSHAETLIVLCSPHAAQSKWVDAEVREFQQAGRADRIFCLLVESQPDGSLEGCFPPSLIVENGSEPLAADLRKQMDGRTGAKLKLVSGILGLDYNQLRQREQNRRNRQLALVAAASLAALVVTAGLALEAIRQRDIARTRTATAEQTVAFVKSMFEVADPSEARGSTITAREILDGAKARYRTDLRSEPVVQSEIALTLAEVYRALGLFDQSAEIAKTIPPAGLQDAQVASRAQVLRGDILSDRGEYEQAARAYRQGLRSQQEAEPVNPPLVSRAYVGLGQALSAIEGFAAATHALQWALKVDQARGEAGRRDVARDLQALGLNHFYAKEYEAAERDTTSANAIRLELEGPNSPSVSDNINTLASIAYKQGHLQEAEKLFRSRMAIDRRVLGQDHPDYAITLNNLARVLVERRAFAKAAEMLAPAIEITRRKRGDTFGELGYMLGSMAIVERSRGRDAAAEDLLREAIAIGREQEHPSLALNLVELAGLQCDRRQFADAAATLDQARPVMAADFADDPARQATLPMVEAQCQLAAGHRDQARRIAAGQLSKVMARWPAGSYNGERAKRLQAQLGR
jgi:tetratricopeptide (TPR) repeat protein